MIKIKNNNAMQNLKKMVKEQGKENVDYVKFVNKEILHEGDQLLFLSITGSQLYGLNTSKSDLDIKGVILPSKESLLLQKAVNQFR